MKQPWAKFYFADWKSESCLRMCCLAARGLWMEMLCIMHTAEPRGDLTINREAIDIEKLSILVGAKAREIVPLIEELERRGVFSRDLDGTIYSRRMRKDAERTATAQAYGSMGGNPKLMGWVNPKLNGQDKPYSTRRIATHKPESYLPKKSLGREARVELEAAARRNAAEPPALSSELAAMLPKARP